MNQTRTWELVGAPYDLSANETGAAEAPSYIRKHYIQRWLPRFREHWGISATDGGDVPSPAYGTPSGTGSLAAFSDSLFQRLIALYHRGFSPLVIGGDHSVSIGSVSAASAFLRSSIGGQARLGLLWLDAHADLNTGETGNLHGKAAAVLLGYGPSELTGVGSFAPKVHPENLHVLGVQELMPTERDVVRDLGIAVESIRAIDGQGIRQICVKAIESLGRESDRFYLSVDVDACQGEAFGACAAPMVGGLTARELCTVVELACGAEKLLGMDIVEYCPGKDTTGNTGRLITNVLHRALGYSTQF